MKRGFAALVLLVLLVSGLTAVGAARAAVPSIPIAGLNLNSSLTGYAFDSGNGYVYLSDLNSSSIYVVSGTSEIAQVFVNASGTSLYYDGANSEVYVVEPFSGAVVVVRGTSVVGSLSLPPDGPLDAAFDSANQLAYLPLASNGSVAVVSGTTVVARLHTGPDPVSDVYDPMNGYVYVSDGVTGNVSVISGTSTIAEMQVGGPPTTTELFYDPANGYVYASLCCGGARAEYLPVISGTRVIANVSIGFPVDNQLGIDSSDGYVYVGGGYFDEFAVVSGTEVIADISANDPSTFVLNPSNNELYYANSTSGSIYAVTGTKPSGSPSVIPATDVQLMLVDPATRYLYVATNFYNVFDVFNAGTVSSAVYVVPLRSGSLLTSGPLLDTLTAVVVVALAASAYAIVRKRNRRAVGAPTGPPNPG